MPVRGEETYATMFLRTAVCLVSDVLPEAMETQVASPA